MKDGHVRSVVVAQGESAKVSGRGVILERKASDPTVHICLKRANESDNTSRGRQKRSRDAPYLG